MNQKRTGCLVCGAPLKYSKTPKPVTCVFCGREFSAHAVCENGHYVCDECHSKKGIEGILRVCRGTDSRDPVAIAMKAMRDPFVAMHGPEHHVLVGAALLAAYRNSGGGIDLDAALEEMRARGAEYPGGACGYWGCCGAAVSAGMFLSIVTGADPLSRESWSMANRLTSLALKRIADQGGPRCCKRDSYAALLEAVKFCREELGVSMQLPEKIVCPFFRENNECLEEACPYNPRHRQ